ncbi:hypothetical protein [Methylobacterium gnaphalii]|uniref:hypothetical protein n=2 Tax=Methylobacterium gnaphalii TaxID=1010610 RepID=UPI001EE20B43|nr:hypothetical protein [Methylobacterium gnaphalii]GJD70471.1 hypothetical protein MMMDOFMJ_3420 [Methylobacterium gnaphalii]GLS51456.1 hypothetical protein GCM10007885_43130 [Methylobacterium gnaphalii]
MTDPFDPDNSPAAEFERYLSKIEPADRYTRPTYTARPFHPYRDGPAWGLAIVVAGLGVYWLAGVFGWR